MSSRLNLFLICSLLGCLSFASGFSSTQPADQSQAAAAKLAELDPNDLNSYLLIGEYLGAGALSPGELHLASQVLAIGIGLADRQDQSPLAASMCIALSDIEQSPDMSSTLWDLAVMLDPQRRSAWLAHRDHRTKEQLRLRQDSARCIYSARFNDPKLASSLFGRKDVRDQIKAGAIDAGLDPANINRLLTDLISSASADECRGRVFITKRIDGEIQRVLCPDHARPIGVANTNKSLRQLIKLELVLLGQSPGQSTGQTGSDDWRINAYLDLNTPAHDPSPAIIAQHYRVDLAKPYWRGDQWGSTR